ncbi:MAG: hypothetical protein JW757_11530 [Anaerolineales bacterium]|nr:hypothetical protein [Anaerolineales bacterium]
MNQCVLCGKSSDEIPLIPFEYKGNQHYVCTAHLPALLHKPEIFADKLAGAGEDWVGEHDHE